MPSIACKLDGRSFEQESSAVQFGSPCLECGRPTPGCSVESKNLPVCSRIAGHCAELFGHCTSLYAALATWITFGILTAPLNDSVPAALCALIFNQAKIVLTISVFNVLQLLAAMACEVELVEGGRGKGPLLP